MTDENLHGIGAIGAQIERLTADLATHLYKKEDGRSLLFRPGTVPIDMTPADWLRPRRPHPVGAVTLHDQDSFIGYVRRFTNGGSSAAAVLFAHCDGRIRCLFDYHTPTQEGFVSPDEGHQACYHLLPSEEWVRWEEISGELLPQNEFVRFLEENSGDIEAPAGADILELARDFSSTRKVNFSSALRTDTGDISFSYTTEAAAQSRSGDVLVPTSFRLRIPVFNGEPASEVYAFLRWNINDGALKLGIQLHRPVFVKQSLFRAIAMNVAAATSVPVFFGAQA